MSRVTNLSVLDPASSALLVVDMQNAFCYPEGTLGVSGVDVGPAREVYGPIRRLAELFKAAEMPVIWTVQAHLQPDQARNQKRLPSHTQRRSGVAALAGSWDAAIIDELAELANDPVMVVQKHRFGAFYETRLEALLRMLGVRALFVAGVTLNACVETTLREAYLRDYDVVAVTDCIAGGPPPVGTFGSRGVGALPGFPGYLFGGGRLVGGRQSTGDQRNSACAVGGHRSGRRRALLRRSIGTSGS